jgi:hypothetical protein
MTKAGKQVEDSLGKADLLAQATDSEDRKRALFAGLEHERVSGAQGRSDFVDEGDESDVPERTSKNPDLWPPKSSPLTKE